nr:BON domain-containing protein [Pseudodesulfovibrio hydrargyri]
MSERFGRTKRLNGTDLRVEVFRSHAILIGRTKDFSQKTAALAIAEEVNGLADVVDYISVEAPEAAPVTEGSVAVK